MTGKTGVIEKIKNALPLLLGNALTLFLLLAGGLFAMIAADGLAPDSAVLLMGCGSFSLLFALIWSIPKGGWIAAGLMGLEVFAIYRLWEWLEPALSLLAAAVCGAAFGDAGEWARMRLAGAGELTAVLLLAAFAMAFLLGWLAVRERCWHLPMILVTLPELSALLAGVLPPAAPLAAQAAGWGTLLLTAQYGRGEPKSLGRAVWMSMGGMSALLLLLLALLPREGYDRPQWATHARDGIVESATRLVNNFLDWDEDGWNPLHLDLGVGISDPGGEINGETDLTQAGPRTYSGDVVMRITGGPAGRVYLRGGSSRDYNGKRWVDIGGDAYEEMREEMRGSISLVTDSPPDPALYPALTVPEDIPAETMTIRHTRTGRTAFYPYRLCGFPDGLAELSGDGGAIRTMDEYQVEYIPGGPETGAFIPLSGGAAETEEIYRHYVRQNYLKVSPEAMTALAERFSMGPSVLTEQWERPDAPEDLPEQYRNAAGTALYIAKWLSENAVYDLDVPAMNPGEDFAAHFLEEGRGYCVHFATAGALLLRLCGIPARYVEGYAPWLNGGGVSVVRDSDAHAWVEIYLDGYGWYPVEMTPGRQGETPETVAEEILQTEKPVLPEQEPELPEDSPEKPETPEHNTPSQKDEDETVGETEKPETAAQSSNRLRVLAVFVILALPVGGYWLADLIRRKRRENPDNNRSVIYAYQRYQKLLEWGGSEETVLEELGRKAKFSQHALTVEERETAWDCVGQTAVETRKGLTWWKKPIFMIVFGGGEQKR